MTHPWHDIPLPANASAGTVPVVIEVPKGSKNKYELDKRTGLLRVARVFFASIHYPANYGFVPRTLVDDGDPLDVLVLGQEPIMPLAMVDARAIGAYRLRGDECVDDKIIAVHMNDPAYNAFDDMAELPRYMLHEMMRFFHQYRTMEGRASGVGEELKRTEALAILDRAIARYAREFGARSM